MDGLTVYTKYFHFFIVIEVSFNNSKLRSEINQDTTRTLQQSHIIKQLSSMIIDKLHYRLTLNNYISFTKKIYTINSIHFTPVVFRMKRLLTLKWNTLFYQLHLKPFLITVFVQSCSQFLVDFMQSPHDVVYMMF